MMTGIERATLNDIQDIEACHKHHVDTTQHMRREFEWAHKNEKM